MINKNNLLKNQENLQYEAKKVVDKLDLIRILSEYGKTEVVGSLEYGLMVWRDIDIDLVFKNEILETSYWEIVKKLFSNKEIQLMTLSDNRKIVNKNRPKSLYIGIKYLNGKGDIWKIDIRLLNNNDLNIHRIKDLIDEKITPENKLIILEIKSKVCNDPKYHKDFSSVDIYEAVLLKNIKNTKEFWKYLKQ